MSTTATIALYDDLRKAIATKTAIVVMYRTGGVTPKARVILPRNLHTTKDGADVVYGYDSLRKTELSFRVDRIEAHHTIG